MSKTKMKTKKQVTHSFCLIMLASGLFGAALSFAVIVMMKSALSDGLPGLYVSLQRLSPWIFLFLAAAFLLSSWWSLMRARRFCRSLNDSEDEAFYQQADRYLDQPLAISNIGTIVLFTWFGMVAVSTFEKNCGVYLFLLIAFLLIAELVLLVLIQRKTVEQVKLLNPEKRGDALDIRFQKEWLESCDEQEQLCVYRASYKAFSALPVISGSLFILLVLFLPYARIGFLPFLCVGLLWLVPTIIYFREAKRSVS